MRFNIWSFVVLTVAVGCAATDSKGRRSINPPRSSVRHVDFASLPPAAEPATNAERFARGLPPINPRSRKAHRADVYHDIEKGSLRRASRVASARRADTSPGVPMQKSCNLLASTKDGKIGYLSRQLNFFGEYGLFQSGQQGSLAVSFSYVSGSVASTNLLPTNGVTQAFPYVGGVISAPSDEPGANSFGPGRSTYAYLAATKPTSSGSPPVIGDNSYATATGTPSSYESAIWIYNPTTNEVRAQWVNDDGSTATTYLLYGNDGSDVIILTGDPSTLNRDFETNYPEITFTCAA